MNNKTRYYRKLLLKLENDIVRENRLFCATHDIAWTKHHDTCLINGLRTFFEEGLVPIVKDVLDIDDIYLDDEKK